MFIVCTFDQSSTFLYIQEKTMSKTSAAGHDETFLEAEERLEAG